MRAILTILAAAGNEPELGEQRGRWASSRRTRRQRAALPVAVADPEVRGVGEKVARTTNLGHIRTHSTTRNDPRGAIAKAVDAVLAAQGGSANRRL